MHLQEYLHILSLFTIPQNTFLYKKVYYFSVVLHSKVLFVLLEHMMH